MRHLAAGDRGRATLLIGSSDPADPDPVDAPAGTVAARDTVTCDDVLRTALHRALRGVVFVEDLSAARRVVAGRRPDHRGHPHRRGPVGVAGRRRRRRGRSRRSRSRRLWTPRPPTPPRPSTRWNGSVSRAPSASTSGTRRRAPPRRHWRGCTSRMPNWPRSVSNSASCRVGPARPATRPNRLRQALDEAAAVARTQRARPTGNSRASRPGGGRAPTTTSPIPRNATDSSVLARQARQAEMEARLGLRTAEERVRSMSGRADALATGGRRGAESRDRAIARAAQLRREGQAARGVHEAALWLMRVLDRSRELATQERAAAEARRDAGGARAAGGSAGGAGADAGASADPRGRPPRRAGAHRTAHADRAAGGSRAQPSWAWSPGC